MIKSAIIIEDTDATLLTWLLMALQSVSLCVNRLPVRDHLPISRVTSRLNGVDQQVIGALSGVLIECYDFLWLLDH